VVNQTTNPALNNIAFTLYKKYRVFLYTGIGRKNFSMNLHGQNSRMAIAPGNVQKASDRTDITV
jgi:hypothetical protein